MLTVKTCWSYYIDSKTLQPSTLYKEQNRYNCHLISFWEERDMETLKFKDIIGYQKHLFSKGLSPQTVKHCLSLLRRILRRAVQLELFNGQIPYFEMPNVDNRRMRFLTESEAQKLLSALYTKSELWHDITLFALNTGMRAGEIFSITKNNINLTQKNVTIYRCKNAQARTIPLNQITINIAKKYIKKDSVFLFCTPASPERELISVSRVFQKTVVSIGLNENISNIREKIVFHSLRHTFASWLVQRGIPLLVVSNLLGHKSLQMTLHYAHLAPDQDRTAINSIPDNLSFPNTY